MLNIMIDILIKVVVFIYYAVVLVCEIYMVIIVPVFILGCIYSCCTGKKMPWMKDNSTTFKGTVSIRRKEKKDSKCTIEEKWW